MQKQQVFYIHGGESFEKHEDFLDRLKTASLWHLPEQSAFGNGKKWTATLLGISTMILIAAFIGLKIHANSGGVYETKTIGAMIFRISVTLVFAIIAYFTITKKKL